MTNSFADDGSRGLLEAGYLLLGRDFGTLGQLAPTDDAIDEMVIYQLEQANRSLEHSQVNAILYDLVAINVQTVSWQDPANIPDTALYDAVVNRQDAELSVESGSGEDAVGMAGLLVHAAAHISTESDHGDCPHLDGGACDDTFNGPWGYQAMVATLISAGLSAEETDYEAWAGAAQASLQDAQFHVLTPDGWWNEPEEEASPGDGGEETP